MLNLAYFSDWQILEHKAAYFLQAQLVWPQEFHKY